MDWRLAALVTIAAVVGSFGGARLAGKVPPEILRRGFAWFVVVMAVFILSQEMPKAFGWSFTLAANWPVVVSLVAVPLVFAIVSLSRAPPSVLDAHR